MKSPALFVLITVITTLASLSLSHAQSTAFTYQGALQQNGVPYTGSAEVQPTLWNAVSGGTQLAAHSPATIIVGVTNGLFTASFDFGSMPFSGPPLWLQLDLRTSIGAFTTLTPRQNISPTPYAISAMNLTGTVTAGQLPESVVTNGASGLTLTGSFSGGGLGLTGLSADNITSGALADARLSANVALRAGGNTFDGSQFFNNGSVGIGTVTPATALHVKAGTGGAEISVEGGFGPPPFGFPGRRWTLQSSPGNFGSPLAQSFQIIDRTAGFSRLLISQAGNVGINTNDLSGAMLSVNGSVTAAGGLRISGANTLELGAGMAGKEINAGKIGYGTFAPDALSIVGAGTSVGERKIQFNNEGGATFIGPVAVNSQYLNVRGGANEQAYLGADGIGGDIEIGSRNAAILNAAFWNSAAGQRMNVFGQNFYGVTFNPSSDRNAKLDFKPVDTAAILEKVVALPITEWAYKSETEARHVGPVAQDFKEAFGLGTDDKHIATVDADGVALAAIQGLNEKVEQDTRQKDAEIAELKQQNSEMMRANAALLRRLEALEARLK